MLQRGVPKTEIARRLGISRGTVGRIAARVGFPAKARSSGDHDWVRIREFYDSGRSAAATQEHFGFSDSTWEAAIARGDVVPRSRPVQHPPGRTRTAVAKLLDGGRSIAEVAAELGISPPTVCYHARKLGVPPRSEFARRYDWAEIGRAYESGLSMRECMQRFGFSSYAWGDAVRRGQIQPRSGLIPIESLLVVGRRTTRTHLKARLLAAGLKDNRCERCGISDWMGEPLNMHLHHVNGDGLDNRLENLEMLCGNCHAQTDTYGGRNGHRRTFRLSREEQEVERQDRR